MKHLHERKAAARVWPLATTLVLKTFKKVCMRGGGSKTHAKIEFEFPQDYYECDMYTHAHVLTFARVFTWHPVLGNAVWVQGSWAQAEPEAGTDIVHCIVSDMKSTI